MKQFLFLPLLILLLCGSGCSSTTSLSIKYAEGSFRTRMKKVISIQPHYFSSSLLEDSSDPLLGIEEQRAMFEGLLETSARKAGLELEIYTPYGADTRAVDYFNDLLPLRKSILQAFSLQDLRPHDRIAAYQNSLSITYKFPIKLPMEYSSLASKYGTSYFSLQGLIDLGKPKPSFIDRFFPEDRHIFYHIVVDVVRSEVIFRELRGMSKEPSESKLKNMLRKSFRLSSTRKTTIIF